MAFTGRGQPVAAGGGGPDREAALTRYALLPLRVFLGVTFIYAGLDKLTDSAFMAASGPGSLGELMHSVRDSAAIPGLVDLALKSPTGFGYALAAGELAVGIGTLFGIFARLAAAGGALISLSLWLTVSWTATPYYYGNDLAYLMAWLPLIVAGAPVYSVDALWPGGRRRRRGRRGALFT
ncbi:thiosulfate dehydrogenase [quinone] large subunit [Streptomyces olivoverticillatus]|uniref:Thiosulfate dehydrogenase [quinone] large subunit n=1 Tax=Streptomyces olivoverticillatus TaxID=66427 RepID=A0A7W7PJ52_9ACTN|nr:DoxX family protein [Streptomyces olivoverticillatus]MBB4891799.1 thiosulfate dehydrogenase [quinone] large subunit [Streptomyces olivoverticillatus]